MRYVYSAVAAVVASMILAPSIASGQAGISELSITNYQFVNEQRVTRTQWYISYRADIVNRGVSALSVTATVTSLTPAVEVVAGQGTLHFPLAPPNSQVTSLDTFTLLVDRSVPFDFGNLKWSFLNPAANAGPNQTAPVGKTVILNGSGSSNPSGVGSLTYTWAFKSRPASSIAVLSGTSGVMTSFVVDVPGTYVVTLTVSNGVAADSTTVTISTVNSPPVAKPGSNQTVAVGSTVTLNGSGSSDIDGDPLTYLWSLVTQPVGSSAALFNLRSPITTFVADKAGTYVVQLVVNDGIVNSAPATVTITTANTAPVANAGPNQSVNLGALVQLNGAGSTDVDGNPLTFKWSFNSTPNGSTAALSNSTAVNPTFTADRPGTFVAQLIVNDGQVDSTPSTVTVTTNALQAPVANAGPNQTVLHGATVTLSGSGTDPQGLPLTLTWSLSTRPPGSAATLSDTTAAHPTLIADKPGTYVAQLIVSNGYLTSPPATVTITTTNTPPVAVAGANQNVAVGVTVFLDGSSSSDPDGDPLTYSWSLTSRPPSSTTVIQGTVTKTPSFLADVPGTYVAQLIVSDGFTNSSPATVTITANQLKVTLSPNPLNLVNSPHLLTITLGAPAGPGGVPVILSGYDPNVITVVPSTVTVPENSTGANVTVTPLAAGSTNILATAPGYQPGTAAVTVTTPTIALTLSSTAVGVTHSITGTITLSAPAPADTAIGISSSPVGRVTFDPASVTIPAGSTTGTFKVIGGTEGAATITAAAGGFISGTVSVLVVSLGGILLPTDLTVPPGQSATLDVKISSPAPVDGVTVTLVSGDSSILTVSPSVFIPQGSTTPTTPAQVNGVKFGSTTVTASAGGYTGDSRTVKVAATLSFSPQVVTVGAAGDQSVSLILSAPAPAGGLSIALQSSNTAVATVPPTVVMNAGSTSAQALVSGVAAGSATVTASTVTPNVSPGSLTVTVSVFGSIILPSNVTVGQGQSLAFPITLSAPAPQNNVTVALSTSNSNIVDILPKSVIILAGQTQPASQPQLVGNGLGQATITASAGGYGSTSQTVQGNTTLSFTPQALTITGIETKDLTLTLPAPAPSGGLTVNISASPAGVVTVPTSVAIAQNTTTATVHVTGVAAGTTTITAASSPNVVSATASVTVQNAGAINLTANVTVGPSQALPFAVTLTTPAPQGGVTVTLSSGDPTKLSIAPTSVFIDTAKVQPATQPQVTGVDFGSASITASAPGYTTASQSVKVGASLSFPPGNVTIVGPDTQNLTLTLSAPASSAVSVNLSATPAGIVTFPPTVTIAQSATTVTVALKGASVGTTTITASSSTPNISTATANATVQSAGAIGLPSNVMVGLGQSTAFQVTLPAPAPQGGVTATLSSDLPKVTFSPSSVTIDAGQTQPTVAPQVTGKDLGTANITASAPAYTSATKSIQVTATISFSPSSLALSGTETQNLTLTLSGPAPSGGITFNVSSSNTSVATVGSATATMAAGATTATIAVSGVAAGSAVIHASASNLTDATANVTVTTSADIILPAAVSVSPGDSVAFPITLGRAASSSVFLDLTSSDPTKATVSPASITIAAGDTQSRTSVRVYGVATGSATITVKSSNGSLSQATSAVTVGFALSISPANLTIMGSGNTGTLYLTLSGPAPVGGIDLTLTSSNPSVATVPSIVPLSANSTSIGVRVTSAGVGTTVIHVSGPNIPEATATVTVVPPGSISISGPVSVGLGQTGTLTVTLSSPATGSGVNVDLTSSDATKVSVSPTSVAIPAGATAPVNQPQLYGVNLGSASISASATGFASPAPLVVQVNTTVTWVSQNVTIVGTGNQAVLQLKLNAVAPLSGLAVTLSSSNPAVATIQGSANFTFDGTQSPVISIPVTAAGLGTTIIHASGTNIPDTATTVTVSGPLAITTTALPNGVVGSSYNGALVANGGTPPYTWAATGLPAGLSIDPSAGAITGAPATAGGATVNVTVTDSTSPTHASMSKQFPVTIAAALGISTASLPNGVVGTSYNSGSLSAAGGTPPYAWIATGLPAGLSIDPSTGAITGTPTSAGAATVNVTVTDATNPTHASVSKQFPVTIFAVLAITTASLPNGTVGTSYNSGSLSAAGGTPPYAWAATGLPAGLSIDPASGAITGTPTTAGATTVNVTLTDATSPTHATVSKQFPVTIATSLAITTAALPNGTVGTSYNSGSLSAAGGNPPYAWAATGLPAGLSIDPSTGAITGTPTAAGAATVNVTLTDATSPTHATVSKQFPVTIATSLAITTASLPNGVVGTTYNSGTLSAAGGIPPYAWAATGLPAGLSMDPATGTITGAPTIAGAATVNVTVTDSTSPTHVSATKQLPFTIAAVLAITTASLPNGVVGTSYNSGPLSAAGGTPPYAWSATGLPAGLSMDPATGAITGNPTTAGAATVNVTLTDVTSPTHATVSKQFPVTIGSALAITTVSLPNGTVGAAYNSGALSAAGGTPSYTWAATGLPAGLSMDPATGAITGAPTTAGAATVNVTVTDSTSPAHNSASKQFPVTIAPALAITTASLPNGTIGTAYSSGALSAAGGNSPYAWSAAGLPAGLSMDPATGAITGTPTAAGGVTVNVTVTDATSPTHATTSKQFPVTIATALTISTTALPNGVVGTTYNSGALSATGGNSPYAWSATGLPAGLSMDPATGAISGNPTTAGALTVNITVTDATSPTHATVSKQFPVTIASALAITTTSLPNGTVATAYNSGALSAAGGTHPYVWSATGLPAGLSMDSVSGAITGTPTNAGAATVNVTLTDATSPTHASVTKQFPVTIATALTITTTALPNGVVGASYNSGALSATGGNSPYAWSASGLPAGVLMDPATGAITGNPITAGAATVNVTVTDATSPTHASVSKQFPVTIATSVTITTAALPNGVIGIGYSSGALSAAGGTPPYAWSATGLPAGLSIDPATGAITGNPTTAGAATVNVTVTDATSPTHASASRQFPVTIATTPTITTAALPNGTVGTAYNSGALSAAGGNPPYAWTATGLPAGFSIDPATGAITGNPTTAGAATVNVTLTDATSPTHASASKQFPITIAAALTITTAALPNGTVGTAYNSGALSAAGGNTPYTWTATGLPAGLSMDSATGAITGNPTTAGAATVIVTLTDATSPTHASVSKQFPVTIAAALTITTAALPNGAVGTAYNSGALSAAGGNTPYTWTATGLPAGLSINPATGAITGNPTSAGAATVSVTVADATSPTHASTSKQFQFTIATVLAITTTSLPNGTVGTAYNSGALSAAGGNPPYAWTATGLPAGLSIDPATGAITGNPTTAGAATVNVTVTDATSPTHATASKQFPVTIATTLTITTAALPNGTVGTAYNSGALSATGGNSPYAWSATGLPNGLSINPATGAITGSPTTAGAATVNVTVTDATSPTHASTSKQFQFTIATVLAITTTSLPNGAVGTSYNSGALSATGGNSPYAWSATGLPAGLSIDPATGAITGTPSTAGAATVNVTVTDATSPTHASTSKQFQFTIATVLAITTTSLPNGTVGTSYSSGALSATGGNSPYAWTATGLPAGLSIDPTNGTITGTPTTAGAATVNVTVTDATSPTHASASKQFPVTIAAALAISTASLPNGVVGAAYNTGALSAAGGTPSYTWAATGLPAGLSMDPATGAITGAPTTAGAATVNVTVTDSTSPAHNSASKQFPVTIAPALAITTASLPNGVSKSAYSFTVAASGGTSPYTWTAPDLPNGLSIDSATGAITGTTTVAGTTTVNITVTDTTSPTHLSVSKQFSLIMMPALAMTTLSLPGGVVSSVYTGPLTASGGTSPYTWTATGLPAGLTLDTATSAIKGTPTAAGTVTVSVTVTDSTSPTHQSVSRDLTLTVGPALAITTASLKNGVVGSTYNDAVAASGGTQPYVWSQTGLPAGLTLDPASGAISGNPTASGPATVNITVTDATNPTHQSVSKGFSITMAAALTITTASLPNGVSGTAYNGPMAATGGTPPYTWSATGLPGGLSIDATTGAVTGSPNAIGSFTVNVLATDSTAPTHQSSAKQYPVTIAPGTLTITSSSLPGGQVGVAYSTTVAATGGTLPLHWSATGLPNGLTINATTGQITGTPTATGTSSVNLFLSDSGSPVQTANKTLSITVQGLTITTTSLPTGLAGTSYSSPLTASGGVTPLTWSVLAGAVPRGMRLDPLTGVFSGTPTFPGTSNLTFGVSDSSSPPQNATKDLTLTVMAQPLAIDTASLSDGQVNTVYTSPDLTASGGLPPYSWSATGLPTGLLLSSSGTIAGTPTVAGIFYVIVTVTDGSSPAKQTSKTFPLSITLQAGGGLIVVTNGLGNSSNITVGNNLQMPVLITFTPALPTAATLTLSSGNPALVTLGAVDVVGTGAMQVALSAGTGAVFYYVKALGSSGQVTVTASLPGYTSGTGTVTLANSGFVVSGANGIGGAIDTFLGVSSTLTLYAARLDSTGLFFEREQLRGGYSVNVPIGSTVPSVGNVSSPTVTFSGGVDNATAQFVASQATTGVTNVIVGPVPGFTQPAAGASLVVTVNTSGLVPFTATIGKNLQKNVSVSRTGSTLNQAIVTVHSQDSSKLKFSTTPTGATSDTITVTISQSQSVSPDFYAHAFDSTGTVAYTISSTGYGSVGSTVTMAPSGLLILSPTGPDGDFTMSLGTANATLSIYSVRLDSGNPAEYQAVASGMSISAAVAADNAAVGSITVSPVTIVAGGSSASTQFHAAGLGTSNITASAAGYGSASVAVTVQTSNLIVSSDSTAIGKFLQTKGSLILPVPAPAGGVHVTLQSNSPYLKLSTTATGAGSATIGLDVAAGSFNAPDYYIQSLDSSGTVTYTATAPGYGAATASLDLMPSGIVILGPSNVNLSLGAQTLQIIAAQLSSTNDPANPQQLAGGGSLVVSLFNANRNVGTVPGTVTIAPGTDRSYFLFTPLAAGNTTISVVQPDLWTVPTSLTSLGILVQ
jgi:Putative Ig domain/PKD domain